MTIDKLAGWVASALVATTVGFIIIAAGGPGWAAIGFGLVCFYLFRLKDGLSG